MARLQIEFQGTSTVVPIKSDKTTVGRSGRCTISLPDPDLAAMHFRIEERSRGWRLKDDGSGIPTLVNGKPVFATTLRDGDVIEAGGLRCVFLDRASAQGERPAEPAPAPARAPVSKREAEKGAEAQAGPSSPDRKKAILIGAGVTVAVIAAFFLLTAKSPETEAQKLIKQAHAQLAQSRRNPAVARMHLNEAVSLLDEALREFPSTKAAPGAALALTRTQRYLGQLDAVEEEERSLKGVTDPGRIVAAYPRLARLKKGAHPAVTARIAALEKSLSIQSRARVTQALKEAQAEADAFLTQRRFGDALRVWRGLLGEEYDFRVRAETGVAAVEAAASKAFRSVLQALDRAQEIDVRIALLEAQRSIFVGTVHANELEVRISGLRARRLSASAPPIRPESVVQKKRDPNKTRPETGQKGTEPVPEGAYRDPREIAQLVARRRYGEAAAKLHRLSRHRDAPVRVEELTRLANLMADLVGAIRARPQEFPQIVVRTGVRRDAIGADTRSLKVNDKGVSLEIAWSDLSARSFPRLLRLAKFLDPPRLDTALFFLENGLEKEANKAFVGYAESGQDLAFLNRALARRRDIDVPKDGFHVFRGRLVTSGERDAILLEEKLVTLARHARSSDERRRRAAWTELEKIGDAALEVYAAALRERRKIVADEFRGHAAFSKQRAAGLFGRELRARRKHALEFIMDPKAYPYPNKTAAAQKEVEDRVDKVREIFETPYKLLLNKSESAQALGKELQELDSKLDLLALEDAPISEKLLLEIDTALDMKHLALDGRDQNRIHYNDEVTKYNLALKDTTVQDEERANVKAVNDYRWMMGLHCVKIDERLVRAARKHSIEMAQLNYFAHDSPTPALRRPGQRAAREGYGGGVGENIARGPATGAAAFWGWFRSSGHHRNMANPGWRDLGCGAFADHWWTQNFGRMTGNSLKEPQIPKDPDPPGQSGNGKPAPQAQTQPPPPPPEEEEMEEPG